LVLGVALGMTHLDELGDGLRGVEKIDHLAFAVWLEKAPVARRTVGNAHVTGIGQALLGALDPARQALENRLLAALCNG
jgi:hypothetical protein